MSPTLSRPSITATMTNHPTVTATETPRISQKLAATSTSKRASTSLNALPLTLIPGGITAGSLHAISGPDHLAALLPKCVGQRWWRAVRIGCYWGLGHGISAAIVGIGAFAVKRRAKTFLPAALISSAELITSLAVGLSLVLIGVIGIREAREWEEEIKFATTSVSSAVAEPPTELAKLRKRGVLFNGLLHGFSWDGAPSLAGALAVTTWRSNILFLISYGIGTILTMGVTTMIIGEGTNKVGVKTNRPDLPQKLSLWSSWLAIVIGVVWTGWGLK